MGGSSCKPEDLKGNCPEKEQGFYKHQFINFHNLTIPLINDVITNFPFPDKFNKALFDFEQAVKHFTKERNLSKQKHRQIQQGLNYYFLHRIMSITLHYRHWQKDYVLNLEDKTKAWRELIKMRKRIEQLPHQGEYRLEKSAGEEWMIYLDMG